MKKKEYVEPLMEIVELPMEATLLAGSDPNTLEDPEDYEGGGDPFNF